MTTGKIVLGALMVAIGSVFLGAEYFKNYFFVPLADIWVPALIIIIAGMLPALLIVFGSILIWGELEEKKAEKQIVKIERKFGVKKRKGRGR
ncbi:MAG: hypothetical protein HY516_04155 [Candidatus Aenigmarchaeota archaeon]|nr:hypothetical protein [Candidatus Aenigmarchaeota archaeon]